MGSRQSDRQRLERLLATDDYQAVLNRLREEAPALSAFHTWADVVAFMQAEPQDPRKNDVLRALFHAHTQSTDPRFRTILLVLFWTGLLSIHHQKRSWDADPDELWQNITWTFLQVLCRIDLTKRPSRLAQKVYNDTIHHLHDTYRHSWTRAQQETPAEPDRIIELAGAVSGIDADIEQRQEHEKELAQLREHVVAGRLTEADYLLVVGTRNPPRMSSRWPTTRARTGLTTRWPRSAGNAPRPPSASLKTKKMCLIAKKVPRSCPRLHARGAFV